MQEFLEDDKTTELRMSIFEIIINQANLFIVSSTSIAAHSGVNT